MSQGGVQANHDIGEISTSTRKITSRGEKIQDVELGNPEVPAEELAPPTGTVTPLKSAG